MLGFFGALHKLLSVNCVLLRRLSSQRAAHGRRVNNNIRNILISRIDPPRLERPEISATLIPNVRDWHDRIYYYLEGHYDYYGGEQSSPQETESSESSIWEEDDFQDLEINTRMFSRVVDMRGHWSPLCSDE